MEYFAQTREEALGSLQTAESGLTDEEAAARLEKYGKNELAEKKKKPAAARFFAQFADAMIIVLLVAAAVSAGFTIYGHLARGESLAELIDAGIIVAIVIINAAIGFIQENKAENALEALREKSKQYAKVIRGGERKLIPGEELTVGDIVAGTWCPRTCGFCRRLRLK